LSSEVVSVAIYHAAVIDLAPNRIEEWPLVQLLWSLSHSDPFQVVETLNPAQFPAVPFCRSDSFRPTDISLPAIPQGVNFSDFEWFDFPDFAIDEIPMVDYKSRLASSSFIQPIE
jgi:hypothetical protein